MNTLIQYVGNKNGVKIFVNITHRFQTVDNNLVLMNKDNLTFTPIRDQDCSFWVDHAPTSGRYEVTDYGDCYEITEAHRDAYPSHLPGYKIISNLKLMEIIPLNGFNNDVLLSDNDKKIINSELTLHEIRRSFRKNIKETNCI